MHWTMWTIGGLGIAMALAACVRGSDDHGRSQVRGKINVSVYDAAGRLVPVASERAVKTDDEWRAQLTPQQFEIARQAGTERPGTCGLLHNKDVGVYSCLCCGLPLFYADTKFESGTGWPSFNKPIADGNVKEIEDSSFGMRRVEIECARCSAHLGHVFDDGPPPTGKRYCMNGEVLKFTKADNLASLADPAATQPSK